MLKNQKSFLTVFPGYLAHEFLRFFQKWNLLAWLSILILLFLSVNHGVNEALAQPAKIAKFQDIQKEYFKKTPNYEGYGRDGIKVLFKPSNAAIFSGYAAVPPDLTIHFDSIVMLGINNNYKGKSLARGVFQNILGFQHIVLYLVSIMYMLYGFVSLRSPEYMRFHSSLKPGPGVFRSIIISRLLLVSLAFILVNALMYSWARFRGIGFTPADHTGLLTQLIAALFMLAIFYSLGVFIGSRKQSVFSYLVLFIAWFILVHIIPGILGSWAENKLPDAIEDYQTELENFEVLMKFEDFSLKENGKFNRDKIEVFQVVAEKYYKEYYTIIQENQNKLKTKIESIINTMSSLSLLSPTTFYMNTCSETGSRGYLNYIDFYIYGQDMKLRFVRFYIDRTIYNDPKVMVSFITGNENIYQASSRVPHYFLFGLLFQVILAGCLLTLSYFSYRRWLFPLSKNPRRFNDLHISIDHQLVTISANSPDFIHQLVNEFLGKSKKLPWEINVGTEPLEEVSHRECLYFFNPGYLPGELKPRHLVELLKRVLKLSDGDIMKLRAEFGNEFFNKRFSKIEPKETSLFLLALAEVIKPKILVLDDFTRGLPLKSRVILADRVEKLKECCARIIDIVSTEMYWLEADKRITIGCDGDKYKVIP